MPLQGLLSWACVHPQGRQKANGLPYVNLLSCQRLVSGLWPADLPAHEAIHSSSPLQLHGWIIISGQKDALLR